MGNKKLKKLKQPDMKFSALLCLVGFTSAGYHMSMERRGKDYCLEWTGPFTHTDDFHTMMEKKAHQHGLTLEHGVCQECKDTIYDRVIAHPGPPGTDDGSVRSRVCVN